MLPAARLTWEDMKVSQSEGGEKKEIKGPTFKMFTLHKVYNINCDSISYPGRDEILEKGKRRILIFPPVWDVKSFLTVDQDNWADFQQQILELNICRRK